MAARVFQKIQKLSSQNINIDARSGCGHALWRNVASGRFYPVKKLNVEIG